MSKQSQEQFEFKLPWVPATPFRPVHPKPPLIQAGKQGNQILQANCIGSESCSSDFTQKVACSDSGSCTEVNGGVNNLKAALFGSTCISGDGNGQRQFPLNLTELGNVPFADLLALANAASAASVSAESDGINKPRAECSSAGLLPVHINLSAQENKWIDGNCTPIKHQNVIPPQNYDLNLPSGTMDALSQTSISDFAPITPEKATRAEGKGDSEIDNLYIENKITENELAAAGVDVNGIQCTKELPKAATESSLTPTKENHNPENEGSHLIELDRTPQQKQRRKKHRPKVITEGKPRNTRKPVTP